MNVQVIDESTVEPILVEEAGLNVRAATDGNSPPAFLEAARITSLIKAAREACENFLNATIVLKTLEIALPAWYAYADRYRCDRIPLPQGLPKTAAVRLIESVIYTDTEGDDQTLAADQYRIDVYSRPPVLVPAYGVTWPAARYDINSIRVRYTAGYDLEATEPDVVPEAIRQAMHLYVAHYFANREAVAADTLAPLPLGAEYLLRPYRLELGV